MSITEKQLRELIPGHSAKEAADILGVTRWHIHRLCRQWWIDTPTYNHIPKEDASLILELRFEHNMTIKDLAEKWAVHRSTVSKFIKRQLEINPL